MGTAVLRDVRSQASLPGQTIDPSGTRDKVNKSGTVPEIAGQLEPMLTFPFSYNGGSLCPTIDRSLYMDTALSALRQQDPSLTGHV